MEKLKTLFTGLIHRIGITAAYLLVIGAVFKLLHLNFSAVILSFGVLLGTVYFVYRVIKG
jgi:hypothetical protein